eukprot:749753-Hanusia_phi.AAC.1
MMLPRHQQHPPDQVCCRHAFGSLDLPVLPRLLRRCVHVVALCVQARVVPVHHQVDLHLLEHKLVEVLLVQHIRNVHDNLIHPLTSLHRRRPLLLPHDRRRALVLDYLPVRVQSDDQVVS